MNDNEGGGSEGSRHLCDISDLERIRAILESIAFNAWVTDAQGESTRTIVGRDAIFGSGTISIEERLSAIHPDDLATLGRAMTEARTREAPFEVTVRGRQTVSGPWRHLLLQGQPLRDSDGRLREWIGATTDVTRRVEAEAMAEQRCEALIASQERLELAFRAAAMGVWDYDMASDVITWTPEAADILGLDRTWIERAELLRRINEDDLAAHRENIRRAIAERTSFRAELRMLRADGSERCFATLGQAHYDANGNPTSIVGTVQDISSAKLESAYLQAQSHILQQIAIGAPIDSITADLLALIESQLPDCAAALTIFGPSGGMIRTVAPRLAPEVLAQVEARIAAVHGPALPLDEGDPTELYVGSLASPSQTERAEPLDARRTQWSIKIASAPQRGLRASVAPLGVISVVRGDESAPTTDERSKLLGIVQLAAIALEGHRSEWTLRDSERRFRNLANVVPQLVWTMDPSGRFTYANERLEKTIGEVGMRHWPDIVHRADRKATLDAFELALNTGEPYVNEQRLEVQPTNEYRWFLSRAVASRDEDGRVDGWYGAATDIHALKETEAALRDERDRLSAIAAAAPSVLFTFVRGGAARARFPYAAPTFSSTFGIDPDDVADDAKAFFEQVVAADLASGLAALERAEATMEAVHFGFRFQHTERGTLSVEWGAAPRRAMDGDVHWHGVMTDVTQRKSLEQRVAHGEKMQAIGCLAGGIAHDFNNLLTVVLNSGHFLRMHVGADPELASSIDALMHAGERGAEMTRQLLAASRQEPSSPKIVDLGAMLTNADLLLRHLLGPNIRLVMDLDPGLALVCVDPSQIEQVILNLVVNARDAMPKGGLVRISTRNVVSSTTQAGSLAPTSFAEVAITDEGHGMPREVCDRAFEPYFTMKPVGRGTGLGLSVVHGIVTQHGGSIDIESEVDRGTTIRFRLPAQLGKESSAGMVPDLRLHRGSERLLVVDDEISVGTVTAKVLRAMGYEVLLAHSAAEATRLFDSESGCIDALLTDISMPDLSGDELAARLRQKQPQLKVAFMSGHSVAADAPRRRDATATIYIAKPFTPATLSRQMRTLLDGRA